NRITALLHVISGLLYTAGEEVVRLQELEGNTLTIHTGLTGVQSDAHILWFHHPENLDIKIVNSRIIRGEIITDYDSERFRDRLQLNRTSGSLTIRNISREDSGLYILQIITRRSSEWMFSLNVYGKLGCSCSELEGNTVTIHTGLTGVQSDAHILWFYGPENADIKIVNSESFEGKIITNYYSQRFRDRLQLNRTSGSLTIRNISREDSGVYKLQINTEKRSKWSYKMDVYGEQIQDYYFFIQSYLIDSFEGKIITNYDSERFRDRLQLNRTSGSLTIRNISREDSGVYKLQINTKIRSNINKILTKMVVTLCCANFLCLLVFYSSSSNTNHRSERKPHNVSNRAMCPCVLCGKWEGCESVLV
uniref:Immunoglobulin domain-containing protein n=1 Tax=Pygocentrus nattereri TaxID=42514 RepID=A0A3B4E2U6_PYGNA